MAALGVITLVLTGFMLIFYAYLSRNTDRDVSFFMSVGVLSFFINLCSNAGGIFIMSYIYLVIAVAFLALGFAVDVHGTIGFYASIGPWFASTFTNTAKIGWQLLSFVLAPVGIVLFFVWYRSKRELAIECGKMGIWGILVWLILLWTILGLVF